MIVFGCFLGLPGWFAVPHASVTFGSFSIIFLGTCCCVFVVVVVAFHEYCVHGRRCVTAKFGLGTVMVSQTITGIDVDVLQNIPLMIVLGGSDAYVNEVAKVLNLTNEDAKWLTTALPPHMAGLTTKALIITGPIRRQAIIELEPSVKGLT